MLPALLIISILGNLLSIAIILELLGEREALRANTERLEALNLIKKPNRPTSRLDEIF